jgi:hypothetical protein
MMKVGLRESNRYPGSTIALLLLNIPKNTVIQGLGRGAYEIGLRITKRLASAYIGAIGIADRSVCAVGCWPSVRVVRDDAVHLLVRPSAKTLDKFARLIGFENGFGATEHDDSLIRLCQVACGQPQINWVGLDVASVNCGRRDICGRST